MLWTSLAQSSHSRLCRVLFVLCFSLGLAFAFGSTSVSALSDSQILSPTQLDLKWQNNTGNEGYYKAVFQNYETTAGAGPASRWVDMAWSGGDMANLHLYNNYNVQFSFAVDVRLAGTASSSVQFPNFVTPGWRNSSDVCAVMDNIEMDVIPITMSSIGYTATVNIRGQLWADNSDSKLCFYGPFFHNLGAQSWDVKISQPSLSINPNWQYDTLTGMNTLVGAIRTNTDTMKNTLNQLQQNGITANVDNSDVVNATNAAANQAHQDSQAQTDAINQQTQQQQNQYDQEKQEEQEREEQGKDSADEAGGIFNFGVLNPFAPIFELFKPGGCASIPIIAGFVGAESTQYCSWFPNSVRSVLTPAFGIASMMLLFGFVMKWLGGSKVIHLGGD